LIVTVIHTAARTNIFVVFKHMTALATLLLHLVYLGIYLKNNRGIFVVNLSRLGSSSLFIGNFESLVKLVLLTGVDCP